MSCAGSISLSQDYGNLENGLPWNRRTISSIVPSPTSFAIDGKQYIAVHAGWGGDSRGMQANLNRVFPGEFPEVPEGGAVWVFALE